jgi:hypothetical protein
MAGVTEAQVHRVLAKLSSPARRACAGHIGAVILANAVVLTRVVLLAEVHELSARLAKVAGIADASDAGAGVLLDAGGTVETIVLGLTQIHSCFTVGARSAGGAGAGVFSAAIRKADATELTGVATARVNLDFAVFTTVAAAAGAEVACAGAGQPTAEASVLAWILVTDVHICLTD